MNQLSHGTTIGLDVGSSNVKAVLLADDGTQLAATSRPVSWVRSDAAVETDAEDLWQCVLAALSDLAAEASHAGGGLDRVRSIGACGQYSSIVPADRRLQPVAPMRSYLDTRGTGHCHALMARRDDAFMTWLERHPVPPVGGGLALGHLLAFQIDEPRVHEATATYLEPVDYVTSRLTGQVSATQGSMFASQLIDNRSLGATAYDPLLVELAEVDATKLPPLVAPTATVGRVLPDLAERFGLSTQVEVKAGMTDSHAAALATGADGGRRIGLAVGTTGVVLATTDRMAIDLDHEVLSMPGVRDGEWLVWAENGVAGQAVELVLQDLIHPADVLGDHRTASGDAFDGFESALAASPAGARGVRFLPWLSGSMGPQAEPSMRGGFIGMSLDSRRVDLVRAAAEGVLHNLRWMLEPVEAFTGRPAEQVVLTGGAARSAAWAQVAADILDRPVSTLARPGHAGARAVAAWAQHLVDGDPVHIAPPDDTTEFAGLGSTIAAHFEPDPTTTEAHDTAHAQFRAAFEALRPLRLGDPAGP